jgi:predicted kinase
MPKLTILMGLPGAGKSTWTKEYLKVALKTYRVNRDTLREMVDFTGPYSKGGELINRKLRDICIVTLLNAGYDVISDDTNLYEKPRTDMINYVLAVCPGTIIDYVTIDTPIEECIRRDAMRKWPVGEAVIRGMAKSSQYGDRAFSVGE